MRQLRELAKRSKSVIVAYKIYDNWQFGRRFRRGNPESLNGSTHLTNTLDQSLAYIHAQFADYLNYGGMEAKSLRDKRVFELGFGDNIGVALKFLAVGAARRVVCVDKFYSRRDDKQQREIYRVLRKSLTTDEQRRFDEAIDLSNGILLNSAKLKCIYGVDVEDAEELFNSEPFDLIVSRSAIQEIYEPEAAFLAMDRLLIKGGMMLHKIDMSDYGIFRDHGLHPLTFLTISDRLYRMMARGSGKPNRKLVNDYRQQLDGLGYQTTILITDLITGKGKGDLYPHREKLDPETSRAALGLLKPIRPRLLPRFRNLPDEELIVSGVFVIARKPKID